MHIIEAVCKILNDYRRATMNEEDDAPRPLPAFPTRSQPGSAEKLAILIQRRERGEALFHPHDLNSQINPFERSRNGRMVRAG